MLIQTLWTAPTQAQTTGSGQSDPGAGTSRSLADDSTSNVSNASDTSDTSRRWLVSLGIPLAVEVMDVSATSRTGAIVSPSRLRDDLGLTNVPLRPRSSGEVRITAAVTGGELELDTPEIPLAYLPFRFFLRGAVEVNLAADTTPNAEGALGPIELPLDASGNPPRFFSENAVLGQGSRGVVEMNRLELRSGAGMVFSTEFRGRPLRIKPSVEYLRRKLDFTGGVNRVVQLPGTGQGIPNRISSLDETRIEIVSLSDKRTFHGLGPGLELELDVARAGQFVVSLSAGFKAFHFLDGRDVKLTGADNVGEQVTFDFELDQWVFRGDTGIRVRWQPR